jgi:acetyl esterase/lipase
LHDFAARRQIAAYSRAMTRREFARGLAGAAAALQAACTPLAAFNRLAPRDPAVRVAQGAPFGPSPRQRLDAYAPVTRPGASPAPVVVFFYGGSWNSGRRQDYAFVGRALAACGFLTLVPDYRLVPEVRYPDFVRDGAAAVRWARDHAASLGGDPDRIALAGHSAGAYNAMMLGLDPAFLGDVGVPQRAIRALAGFSGPYDFLPLRSPVTRAAFGGVKDLAATQPINHVGPTSPPAFLAHGLGDTLVRPRNATVLAEALRRAGVAVKLELYPGLSHADTVLALSRPFRRKASELRDAADFLHAHLAGPLTG